MRRLLITSLLVAFVGALTVSAPAEARVPRGFVGMGIDGPFFYPGMDENGEMGKIAHAGVQSVRTLFNWAAMQPYRTPAAVPPARRAEFITSGGVPVDFSQTDEFVRVAAAHHLTVLPVLEYTPAWDSRHPSNPGSPPVSNAAFGRFAAALVKRYGPRGSFWSANPRVPRVPIRMWQIWNEPNFRSYWSTQPFERSYVKLVAAAHGAIKANDRGSKIVLAGLANFSWQYLTKIYKVHGARKVFDVVSAHPYTATPAGVITILGKVRAVMNRFGDRRKALVATEMSWPSAKGKAKTLFENATTESGEAHKISQAVPLLAHNRKRLNLMGFYWYTWITNETLPGARVDPFNFAGLWKFIDGVGPSPKPGFAAFVTAAHAIER
jgi:hypothetical protein